MINMLEDVVVVWCVNWFERVWNGAPFLSCPCLLMRSKRPMGGLGAIIMGPECICECVRTKAGDGRAWNNGLFSILGWLARDQSVAVVAIHPGLIGGQLLSCILMG